MLKRIAFPTLALHDLDATEASGFSVQAATGLGEPTTRVTQYDKPGEDGAIVASLLYGARLVTFTGRIEASDALTFESRRHAFVAATRPIRNRLGRPETVKITLTTRDSKTYFINGVVKKQLIDVKDNTFARFLLEVICPDSAIFGDTTVSTGQVTRPTSTGAAFPWTFNPTIEFGSTTGGVASIDNAGTAAVWPLVEFRGPLTNPGVYHEESGSIMQLNVTLGTNDTIVIDMKEHTIVLNDATSYLAYKTTDSEWFSIEPGVNTLRLTTGSTADTGTMEATVNPGYLAI